MHDRNNVATTTTDNDTEAEKNVNCLRCKYIIEQRRKAQNKAIANLDGLFYVCHRCREKAQRDKKSCQQCYDNVSHARSFFIDSQDQKAQHEGKIEQTKSLKSSEIQEVLKKLTQHQDTDHKEVTTFIESKIPLPYYENGEQNKATELFKTKRIEREKLISTTNLKPNIDSFMETQLKPSIPKDPAIDQMFKYKRQFTESNSKDAPGFGIRFVKSSGQPSGPQIPNNINNINTYVSDSLQTLDMINLKIKSASEIDSLSFHYKEYTPHILKTSMINESYSEENIISKKKQKEIIKRRRIKSDDNLQKHSHFFLEQQKKRKSSLSSYSSETLSPQMSSEFRYHFLKKDEDKKPRLKTQKSSSELISEVQDLLRVRYEMEIAKEEQRKKKIEEIERKRIAQEEMKHETQLEKAKDVKEIPLISISSKKLAAEKQKEKDRVSVKSKMSRTSVESEKYKKIEDEKQYVGTEQERRLEEKLDFTAETEGEKTKPEKEEEFKKASTKEQSSEMSQLKTFQDIEKLRKQEVMGTKIKQTDSKEKSPKEQKESKELKDESTQPNQQGKAKLQQQKMENKAREQKQEFMKPDGLGDNEKDMLVKISEQVKHKKGSKIVESRKERKEEEKQSKDHLEKKTEQNGKIKYKKIKQTEKLEPEAMPVKNEPKKEEKSTTKQLKIDQIPVKKPSPDNLISQLVKLRSDRVKDMPQQSDTTKKTEPSLHAEKVLKRLVVKETSCTSSDFELDSVHSQTKKEVTELEEIIKGEKICKYNPPLLENLPTGNVKRVPILFQTVASEIEFSKISKITPIENMEQDVQKKTTLLTAKSFEDHETSKGIIRYALSDRTYIEKGWTMLPTEKVVRKMNVYRMRPARPEFDWFEHNKSKKLMLYDSGEKLAEFDDNGRGRWFYRNGRLALDYYDAEENNTHQRIVIYSSGEPDERGRSRPLAILATFDYLGNGIVFDHAGKIRLKYNQTEGIVLDRALGPVSHWKWHTLNDPPVLQQVMIDTHMAHKDPEILKLGGQGDHKQRTDNEEMLAIEFDNFIKEKSKKLSQKFKPFQIKMKALKINEYFSLRVLDQATVYLIYRDGTTNLKLNIGMILDHQEIVDTDTAEVGEVSNSLEKFPARTDSLAGLQKSVEYAQRVERARMQRERRLRPPEPSASIDKLTSGISKPLRPPLPTIPSVSSIYTSEMRCKCNRKPSKCNVYYDTRLV